MSEIILSFFAAVGIVLLTMQLCDYFFYRRLKTNLILTVDLREYNEKMTVDIFELIASLRQTPLGKTVIGRLLVIDDPKNKNKQKIAIHYMRFYKIPGRVGEGEKFIELTFSPSKSS